jgi:hypothetical protein
MRMSMEPQSWLGIKNRLEHVTNKKAVESIALILWRHTYPRREIMRHNNVSLFNVLVQLILSLLVGLINPVTKAIDKSEVVDTIFL